MSGVSLGAGVHLDSCSITAIPLGEARTQVAPATNRFRNQGQSLIRF
jgi:hypothetical protein